MTTKLIFQGLLAETHVTTLEEVFSVPELQSATVSVAFVNSSGVDLATPIIGPHAAHTTVFAGIRNGVTTYQGLKNLLDLGVTLYAVDTGRATLVYHPKIYLARSAAAVRLVVGSANFTAGGLNNNIEASLVVELPLIAGENAVADGLANVMGALVDEHAANVTLITTDAQLTGMLAQGRLCDERAPKPPRVTSNVVAPAAAGDSTPVMKLKVKRYYPPAKAKVAVAQAVSPVAVPAAPAAIAAPAAHVPMPNSFVEVWRMDDLKRRDLNIPTEKGTNPTGSINLDKGLLPDGVDFRDYFFDQVFNNLIWHDQPGKTLVEAHARFRLIVKGVDHGEFELRLAHNTSTTSKSYLQGNASTRLSWGIARQHVADSNLIGRSLTLSRSSSDPTQFLIEID